ncbi:MAG TPA: GTP 3',8-cyclase MoaA [Syntrophomonadaceae bacterium]|nr:GTP 3',8-cyclase MoaA [Syntrophomonadaceae bacterium]
MLDRNGRVVDYLRISVTDKCNLRCRYCMPAEGVEEKGHNNILPFEQIYRIVKAGAQVGIRKVRLTGGEPLVRKNIVKLVEDIAGIEEIDDLSITTNGTLFARMAKDLKNAGLKRVNFSLDSLVDERLKYITRSTDLPDIRNAIDMAISLELHPVKLNVVVIKGFNDDEIMDFVALAYNNPIHVRFIEFMPIGDLSFYSADKTVATADIRRQIVCNYDITPGKGIIGYGPAQYYHLTGGQGSVGFISPISNHFCGQCNRIRMTADGRLRSCLYHNKEIDLKMALLNSDSNEQLTKLFVKAILSKPNRHEMQSGWGKDNYRKMVQIGG